MPFLDRGSARVYYDVYLPSERKPSVWATLINGHARGSSDFRAFAKFLSERGISTLVFDNRGSGKTESQPFTFEEMLDDVNCLWQHLGIGSTHLLGISYGGVLSLNLAARHPSLVCSLLLVSTTAQSRFLSGRRLAELNPHDRQMEMSRYFGPEFGVKNPVLFQSLVKQMAQSFDDSGFSRRASEQRAALSEFDFSPLLARIHCPCLILHGSEDRIIPPESASLVHAAIPQSQLEIWEGIGHLFLAEAPKRLYETAHAFFCRGFAFT